MLHEILKATARAIESRLRLKKARPKDAPVPQDVVIEVVKALNAMNAWRVSIAHYFRTGDPWDILKKFGIENWWPVPHKPDERHPFPGHYEKYRAEYQAHGVDPFDVYRVGVTKPLPRRRHIDPTVPPLGPEDYELGLQVAPSESVPELVEVFTHVTEEDVEAMRLAHGKTFK